MAENFIVNNLIPHTIGRLNKYISTIFDKMKKETEIFNDKKCHKE